MKKPNIRGRMTIRYCCDHRFSRLFRSLSRELRRSGFVVLSMNETGQRLHVGRTCNKCRKPVTCSMARQYYKQWTTASIQYGVAP